MELSVAEILRRLALLERRVEDVERKPTPLPLLQTPDFNRKDSRCSRCGLELARVMGYCCPVPDCPTGLGPVMCSTTSGVST